MGRLMFLGVCFAGTLTSEAFAKPKVWLFPTEFSGELAVRESIAAALGADVEMIGETAGASPDVLIHSFAQSEEVDQMLAIKRLSRGKTLLVNVGDPGRHRSEFDLIVLPQHLPQVAGQNVMRTLGLPSKINAVTLERAKQKWASRFGQIPRPVIGVLLGGQSTTKEFRTEDAEIFANAALALTKKLHGSLLVTNSRRTPPKATKAFLNQISGIPFYFYNWNQPESNSENPYDGILAYSHYLLVSGDSQAMLSDAASSGNPTFVYAPDRILEGAHKRLITNLLQAQKIRMFTRHPQPYFYEEVHVARDVADRIRELIDERRCETNFRETD